MNNYNFTEWYNITGSAIHTNSTSIYNFTIDLELITILLIIIMLCQLFLVGYIFLSHIGLIKGRY